MVRDGINRWHDPEEHALRVQAARTDLKVQSITRTSGMTSELTAIATSSRSLRSLSSCIDRCRNVVRAEGSGTRRLRSAVEHPRCEIQCDHLAEPSARSGSNVPVPQPRSATVLAAEPTLPQVPATVDSRRPRRMGQETVRHNALRGGSNGDPGCKAHVCATVRPGPKALTYVSAPILSEV